MPSRRLVLAIVLVTTGTACDALSGLNDFEPTGAGGTTSASSAAGGSGGSTSSAGGAASEGGATGTGGRGTGGDGEGGSGGYRGCLTSVSDDFESGIGATWQPLGASPEAIGGVAQLSWGSSAPLHSVLRAAGQDVIGCAAVVELVEPPVGTDVQAFFYLRVDDANRTGFFARNGNLNMVIRQSGAHTSSKQVAFDHAKHRWWMLRESEGTVHWLVSADGSRWVEEYSAPKADDQDLGNMALDIGGASLGLAAQVAFDNVNLPP